MSMYDMLSHAKAGFKPPGESLISIKKKIMMLGKHIQNAGGL